MFEVGVARTFHALHQLAEDVGAAPHEHSHDYRVEAVVRGEVLGDNGMLLDLDRLGAALKACLDELDASDLDSLPAFRGGPTTVEVVAEHVWERVRSGIDPTPATLGLRVVLYESPDAWAAVDRLPGR